jgi:hypothetical protein
MALWQILDAQGIPSPDQFDDGLAFLPDEEGFSSEAVTAHASALGEGFSYNLIGVPNWHARIEAEDAAREAAEEAAASAEAERRVQLKQSVAREVLRLTDPLGFAQAQIEDEFAALKIEFADDPEALANAERLRDARLAALVPTEEPEPVE